MFPEVVFRSFFRLVVWVAIYYGFATAATAQETTEAPATQKSAVEALAKVPAPASKVLEPGQTPEDARLADRKTLNDHFPFQVPETAGQWHERAESLKRRVLVSTGLWPMPEKTPLEAWIYDKSERDGFTIEKVHFQSLPGHFVTGLLFRPSSPEVSPGPAVLCPHGHGGRNQTHSDEEIADQIAQGAEHFSSGRTPKLARCVQLARMGCVTFIFDMLGYADSIQISHAIAHRHGDARPEEAAGSQEDWIFFSPEADLRLQSIMGLQTWNLVRSLDFLASLPDVDPQRLAVTGGSGGGTQSILLGAIDPRIKVSFPNGMVSTAMQGGCYCENCNYLRVGTGNVELAALFAPKPQAMTAADDWTKAMMDDGYPELRLLYAMIGEETDVYCRPMLRFKHNYNYVTRATMYQWMNRHLQLGLEDPVIEQDFELITDSESKVWTDQHPAPSEVGIPHERRVCRWFDDQAEKQLGDIVPKDEASLKQFQSVFGGAWQVIFDQRVPANVQYESVGIEGHDGVHIERGLLRDPQRKAEIPILTISAIDGKPRKTVVWSHDAGKAIALDAQGRPSPMLMRLVEGGAKVLIADLLHQGELTGGEFAKTREPGTQPLVDDKRSYSAFTFTYNRTLVSERCADLLSVIAHARGSDSANVRLLGTGDFSAAWVTPAAAIAGAAVDRVVIETGGFRFATATQYRDAHFVPGAVKYGDLHTLLALRAPHSLVVVGEPESEIVRKTYSAANANDALQFNPSKRVDESSLDWLLK